MVDGQVGFTPMCLDPVRGFISLLVASLFGAAPAEVLAVKPTRMRLLRLAFAVHKHRRAAAENRLDRPESKTSTAVDRNMVLLSGAYRGPVWSSENQQNGWNVGM